MKLSWLINKIFQRKNQLALLLLGLVLVPAGFAQAGIIGVAVNEAVFFVATSIGGAVLSFGSFFLDTSIKYLIVGMGDFFVAGETTIGAVVTAGWTLIRDLLNMGFIFGLIYIGIKTILNSEDSNTRRQLGHLLVAALLINFSLFAVQVVVDFSNILASQMYSQIIAGKTGSSLTPIADAFLDAAGIGTWFHTKGFEPAAGLMFSFFLLIFFVVAGIAFFLGAVLIVTRFVALILYMMFSPVVFLGWILPQFDEIAKRWQKGVFRYCLFAPVYLFLIYISIKILRALAAGPGMVVGDTKATFTSGFGETLSPQFGYLAINFMIMIGLLWASLKVGDKLSIAGSGMVMKAVGAAQGLVYRNTAGEALNWAINKADKTNMMPESLRRSFVKMRDYGAGGTGWADAEKMEKEKQTRYQNTVRSSKLQGELKLGNFGNMSDREIVAFAKDEKNHSTLLEHAGNLHPNILKEIEKDKEIPDTFIAELKDKHKNGLTTKIKSGDFEGVAKQLKNDAKEIAKVAGKDIDSMMAAKYLVDNPSMIGELGKHINDVTTMAQLKKKIQTVANKRGVDVQNSINTIISNSRNWV